MGLHGAIMHDQHLSDLAVGLALGDQGSHFAFAFGQAP